MNEWFNKRYISRDEHRQAIEYYGRLVCQLYGTVKELRAQIDALESAAPAEEDALPAEKPAPEATGVSNVIEIDFRR